MQILSHVGSFLFVLFSTSTPLIYFANLDFKFNIKSPQIIVVGFCLFPYLGIFDNVKNLDSLMLGIFN